MKTYQLEAFLASLMISCGLGLLYPGQTFLLPQYAVLKLWIGEIPGGFILLAAGLLRFYGIYRNGGYKYSPLWRITGCIVAAAFWLSMGMALILELSTDPAWPPEFGMPLLLPLAATAFVFEMRAAIAGGADANIADSFHLRENAALRKEEARHGSSSV